MYYTVALYSNRWSKVSRIILAKPNCFTTALSTLSVCHFSRGLSSEARAKPQLSSLPPHPPFPVLLAPTLTVFHITTRLFIVYASNTNPPAVCRRAHAAYLPSHTQPISLSCWGKYSKHGSWCLAALPLVKIDLAFGLWRDPEENNTRKDVWWLNIAPLGVNVTVGPHVVDPNHAWCKPCWDKTHKHTHTRE